MIDFKSYLMTDLTSVPINNIDLLILLSNKHLLEMQNCMFFCKLLDQHLIEYHLICSCEVISIEDKNSLKNSCKHRVQKHLVDLNQ